MGIVNPADTGLPLQMPVFPTGTGLHMLMPVFP